MVNEQGFNPSQLDEVNDVVQRAGFSDKRKRNLAIRSGMENPGAFQEQNAGYVQEAQQPSEFVGAGRQLAANQNPDQGIASIFNGSLAKHGTEWYRYGDTDYSNAQFGTNGYTKKDLGYGKYDILDKSNNSLGTGYGSVSDAISAYANNNRQNSINALDPEWKPYYNDFNGETEFDPRTAPFISPQYGNALSEWEALGQLINGSQNTLGGYFPNTLNTPGHESGYGAPYADILSGHAHNKQGDLISGLNTLYGSTPLIMNDKLLGYKMDLGPGSDASPFFDSHVINNKRENMNSQLWREFKNEDDWAKLTQRLGTGQDVFVTKDNAEKLPGWTNEDSWDYKKAPVTGSLTGFMNKIGPLLKMTPLAPFSYFFDVTQSAANGNMGGVLSSLFSSYIGMNSADMAGMAGVDQMPGGGFSGADLADFSSPTSTLRDMFGANAGAVTAAGMGAISALKNGQNPLLGAAGSGLGSLAGGTLQGFAKDTVGDFASKIFGGAASGGVKSLFNQNQQINGSEQGNRSGSLSGFINNNSPSAQNTQEPSQEEKQQLALDLQRKLIQRRQQEQLGGA